MIKYTVDNNIELKILESSHSKEIFDLTNSCRLYLREWLPWVDNSRSIEDVKIFIESVKNQMVLKTGFQMGIWYEGLLVGMIGFHKIDWVNKSTSIGYWLGQNHMGKGIMTKSTKTLVNHAFINLNLNRVEIRCAENNIKSRAIPERLGFTIEGLARDSEWLYDHYVSHVVYGILAKEWIHNRDTKVSII